jgi:DNA-binding GntR family transcriptional regulator
MKQPLVGYTAAPLLDAAGVDDLYELRLLLEPAAAERAATTMTNPELEELKSITSSARTDTTPGGQDDYASYRQLADSDQRFHELVAAGSGSRLLLQTLQRLHPHAQLYRLHFQHGLDRKTIAEHRSIAAAIGRGEAERASDTMTVHPRRSHARIRSALRRAS